MHPLYPVYEFAQRKQLDSISASDALSGCYELCTWPDMRQSYELTKKKIGLPILLRQSRMGRIM